MELVAALVAAGAAGLLAADSAGEPEMLAALKPVELELRELVPVVAGLEPETLGAMEPSELALRKLFPGSAELELAGPK